MNVLHLSGRLLLSSNDCNFTFMKLYIEVRLHGICIMWYHVLPDSDYCLTVKFCYFQTLFKLSFPELSLRFQVAA